MKPNTQQLNDLTIQVRRDILRMVHAVNSGHPGGSLGCTEFLVTLYQHLMDRKEGFDMDAIGERTEELKGEAYKYSREIHSNVDVLLKDVMLETLVGEHSARVAEMGAAEQSVFDGSLLQSLTEQGAEVMHCATLLFLGMVNDATTFAETHGGGGSKSNLKWGKDDDEDNRAWARRCMMMASRMMRPASGKKQKR